MAWLITATRAEFSLSTSVKSRPRLNTMFIVLKYSEDTALYSAYGADWAREVAYPGITKSLLGLASPRGTAEARLADCTPGRARVRSRRSRKKTLPCTSVYPI